MMNGTATKERHLFVITARCALLLAAIAYGASGQIVPASGTTILDTAGGQGTWAGPGQVIEEYPVAAKSDDSQRFGMALLETGPPTVKTTISLGLYPSIATSPNCSVGDPGSDGKNVVFLVQSNAIDATGTPNCSPGAYLADEAPKEGAGYGIAACEGPFTPGYTMTSANCSLLVGLTPGEIQVFAGYLDPILIGNDLFIAHRIHGVAAGYTSTAWQVVHFSIDFTSRSYPTNLQLVQAIQPGNWPANYVANNCEQLYKPTSAYQDSSGNWNVYTQADQVDYSSFPVNSPGNNPLDGGTNACVGFGASLTQSGMYSYNEANPQGTWTQIWPQPGTPLVTAAPNNNSKGYAEFPTLFNYNNDQYLLFISQTASTDTAVDDCVALSVPIQCLPNYNNELVILNLSTGRASTITNLFNPPSALNTEYFPGAPQTAFGGTARLGVAPDEQSFLFALQDQTGRHWLVQFPLLYPGAPLTGTPSTISVSTSSNPSPYGSAVALTAAVPTPGATGNITFYDGTTVLGMAPLTSGSASLTTLLPSGNRTLSAKYNGNGSIAPSVSGPLVQTVTAVAGGAFGTQQSVASLGAAALAVGDFNGDGIEDLVAATATGNEIAVLLGLGGGVFSSPVSYGVVAPNPSIYDSLAVGDLNGDGKPDVVAGITNANAVSVLIGNGDGSFQTGLQTSVDAGPDSIVLADFNGDGLVDIATANGTGGDISVLLGNGDGTLQPVRNFPARSAPASIVAGDFNGDGRPDLAVVNADTSATVTILLGNGDGTFQAPTSFTTVSNAQQVITADFNGDGHLDLVVVTPQTGGFCILLGNGDGTFQPPVSYTANSGALAYSAAVADFNGDGKFDVAIATLGLTTFYGNGDGTFQPADTYPFPSSPALYPSSMAVADFNNDGRVDLAIAGQTSAGILVATGSAATACTFSLSSAAAAVDAAAIAIPLTITASNPACLWSISSTLPWVSTTPSAGVAGSVSVNLQANDTGADRSGTISIGAQSFTIQQDFTITAFSDVQPGAYNFDAVNLLAGKGITTGCQADEYCPTELVTRDQMAVFLVRVVVGTGGFTYSPTPYFQDVPTTYWAFSYIQKLYELGITNGCGGVPLLYCPTETVTRNNMAVFIIRSRYGPTTPFTWNPTPYFADVPSDSFGFSSIQRMYQDGVTTGCTSTPLDYCPDGSVTRGDMAIFLMRGGFNELLPPSEPIITSTVPATLSVGTTATFTVTGANTTFQQGATTLVFAADSGITVNSITVTSATTMQVSLTASAAAPTNPVSIYEQTEPQEAVLPNGLSIQ